MAVIRTCDYGGSVPDPEDVLLLIEVSDTSLSYDLGARLPLYARTAIPEIWIVDEVIERHTDLSGDGYRSLKHARRGEEIESAVLPELAFRVEAVVSRYIPHERRHKPASILLATLQRFARILTHANHRFMHARLTLPSKRSALEHEIRTGDDGQHPDREDVSRPVLK